MDFTNVLVVLGCIIVLWIVGKIFAVPLKFIAKLIINSILGSLLIFIINLIGSIWGFHIGINLITAVVVGLLGIPGALLLIILKLFI